MAQAAVARGERTWIGLFLGAVALCAALLAANAWLGEIEPDSPFGIGYGIARPTPGETPKPFNG